METVQIATNLIYISPDFNARLVYEGIETLAADIKRDGLLQPVVVREKEQGSKKFQIIAGHRRFKAMSGILKFDVIPCVLWQGKEEVDAIFANLSENVVRQNLSGYELAAKVHEIQQKYKLPPKAIQSRLGAVSGSYVGNLLRIMEKVSPKILKKWADESHSPDPATVESSPKKLPVRICTTDFLNKLAKHKHEDQLEMFRMAVEALKPEPKTTKVDGDKNEKGEGEGTGEKVETRTPARPRIDVLAGLLTELKTSDQLRKVDALELAVACVRFCAGKVKKVKVGDFLYDPNAKPEKDEADAE